MFALLLAVSVAVSAAPPSAKPAPSPEAAAKAKESFNAGKKLYDQGKYADAVLKFEEAYAARPHPIIFFNIGKCYELLGETGKGETGKALRAYRDYLRAIPDASDKVAVNDSIANLERRLKDRGLQQVTVFAEPATARIEIDGKDVGLSPASTELKPGPHTLVAKAEGFEPLERSFTMSAVRSQEVTVSLKPGATPGIPVSDAPKKDDLKQPATASITDPPATPIANTAPELTRKVPPPPARKRVFTWVAAGVAVAGAGAGAGLGVVSMGASNDLKKLEPTRTREQADALVGKANSMALGANVSYAVAGVAAVTAVVLFFVEGRN